MEPQPADSLIDLLDQLQDISEPPPVSMWPATWAWAVLAGLLLLALAIGVVALFRHRRATAWRRAALAELRRLAPRSRRTILPPSPRFRYSSDASPSSPGHARGSRR
jgi:hypothetical protein